MRVLCFESRFKPANTRRTNQLVQHKFLKLPGNPPSACTTRPLHQRVHSEFPAPAWATCVANGFWSNIFQNHWVVGYDTMTKRPALIFSTWKDLHQNSVLRLQCCATAPKVSETLELPACSVQTCFPQDLLRKTFRFLDSAKDSSHGWGNCEAKLFITNITIFTAWFLFVSSKHIVGKASRSCVINHGTIT